MENQIKNKTNAVNFLQFLAEFDYVCIPRIQRDYVQGGINKKAQDIRETFVGDLYETLLTGKQLSLDFVYGNVKKLDKSDLGCFYPLDGQQRLTTLFLLHWYGALFIETGENIREVLKKFSYQTRFSSEQFCNLLFEDSVVRRAQKCDSQQPLSLAIKNAPQYSKFWRYDPTVDSMLNMLDCIHDTAVSNGITAENWPQYFDNLNNITFFKFVITDSQEPDDLYVKMNARGKHLTNFENFKAHLQQWLLDNDKLDPQFQKVWKENMDDSWSKFFWDYKNTASLEESTDPAKIFIDQPFWIFLNRISLLGYILNDISFLEPMRLKKKERTPEDDRRVESLNKVIEQMVMSSAETYVSPLLQKEIFCPLPKSVDKETEKEKKADFFRAVARILNLLSEHKIQPETLYPAWQSRDKIISDFFWGESGSSRNGSLKILAFAAYCTYVEQFEESALRHWMQYCHQVCADLHDEQSFAGAVSMILICLRAMRAAGENDIYSYLAQKYQEAFVKENTENHIPVAQWHFSIKDPVDQTSPLTIYSRLFDTLKLCPDGRQIRFQASAIWQEAFKSYLRITMGGAWTTLLDNLEKSSLLRGNISGIISEKDSDEVLLGNALKRFENLNSGKFPLTANASVFISVLKEIDFTGVGAFSTVFDFSKWENWESEVIGKRCIAEAVCKVLLEECSSRVSDPNDPIIWRKLLLDFPELLTNWESESVHSLGRYRGDNAMHLFKKKNIRSGTIVLDPVVHNKISEFLKHVSPVDFEEKIICEEQTFYVCKSVDCILGFGTIDTCPDARVKFTTLGIVGEYLKNSFWEASGDMVLWQAIQNEQDITDFLARLVAEAISQRHTPQAE